MKSQTIRRPAVAGKFYADEPRLLREDVEQHIRGAGEGEASARVACIIAPHAGYPYSGATAGHAYARAATSKPKRVILLGCSHHYEFSGACVANQGAFETPLGNLAIDEAFATELQGDMEQQDLTPHVPEHSLEVHLPFIQVAFGDVEIVPVLFGSRYSSWHGAFARKLAAIAEPTDLLVASTDLSHFHTDAKARAKDQQSLEYLMAKDTDALIKASEEGRCSMCGITAVITACIYALERDAFDWNLLDYRTSAETSGDFSRVVGYAAVSMEQAQ